MGREMKEWKYNLDRLLIRIMFLLHLLLSQNLPHNLKNQSQSHDHNQLLNPYQYLLQNHNLTLLLV